MPQYHNKKSGRKVKAADQVKRTSDGGHLRPDDNAEPHRAVTGEGSSSPFGTRTSVTGKRSPVITAVVVVLLLVIGTIGAAGASGLVNIPFLSSGDANNSASPAKQASSNYAPSATSASSAATTSTPRLAKEYIYAGGRMLATEEPSTSSGTPNPNSSDLVVWRATGGTWYVKDGKVGDTEYITQNFGANGDVPAPADFDNDGLADFCVFRPDGGSGVWYIQPNQGTGYYGQPFGLSTDKPVPVDYDGDGRADIAVWRGGAASAFYVLRSGDNSFELITMRAQNEATQADDAPTPADYDGDGRADGATFNKTSGQWRIKQSSNGVIRSETFWSGQTNDKPVAGDYDGDGKFDLAVWTATASEWQVKNSSNNQTTRKGWGEQASDVAVPGDYDGDGRTDIAVWRPTGGMWYIIESSAAAGQFREVQWGQAGDIPIAAPMKR